MNLGTSYRCLGTSSTVKVISRLFIIDVVQILVLTNQLSFLRQNWQSDHP